MDRRRMLVWMVLAAAVWLPTVVAWGQPALHSIEESAGGGPAVSVRGREYLSQRVVRVFDFEEREGGNFERLPRHWYLMSGPGYPNYTADLTGFDTGAAVSGKYSLKMQSNGGSAGVVLEHGAIAAVPGADYVIAVQVLTSMLEGARVRMSGYFVDQRGRRIDGSVTQTGLTVSNGQWQRLEIRLAGDHEKAAWIVLKLELLQSTEFHPPVLGNQELYRDDIGGAAWWDDVAIFQLPRIEIATQASTNVVRSPEEPGLNIVVRDLTGERLKSTISVYDESGGLIVQQERDLDGRQTPAWTWRPELPGYGWYWADLSVTGERGLVGRRTVAWLWLGEANVGGPGESARFGIAAEFLAEEQRGLLRPMLSDIGSGAVLLDIWRADMTLEQLAKMEQGADPLIEELIRDHQRLTLSLAQVPSTLASAANTDVDLPLALFAGDPRNWRASLETTLVRYGQTVSRWQVGRVGSDEGFRRGDLGSLYGQLSGYFRALSPDAMVILPWSAQQTMGRGADAAAALMVEIPTSIQAAQIPEYFATWADAAGRVALVLGTLDPEQFGHQMRAEDLALRMIEAWRAGPVAIYIRTPWNAGESRTPTLLPDPLLGVFANMIDRLGGRRIVDRMHLGTGVACYILEGADDDGALAVWNESAELEQASMELFLGTDPVLVDIWGNRSELEPVEGKHRLPVGSTPVFIEGINPKLARFRAGLRFEPAFLQSSYKVHELQLQIVNPWRQTINGRLRIEGLEQWTINPRLITFNIPAGEKIVVPLAVTFPISELAGEKLVTAQLDIEADKRYQLQVSTPLEIGLENIEYHGTLSVDGSNGTADVLVTAVVTNRGEEPQSLFAFAVAGSEPRQERIISNLQAGQTIIKRFRFVDAAELLSGNQIRVGLREMDGPAMLNQMLDVP